MRFRTPFIFLVLLAMLLPAGPVWAWQGLDPLWTRDPHAGSAAEDPATRFQDHPALHVQTQGPNDWCLNASETMKVKPGEIIEIVAKARIDDGSVAVAAVLYDTDRKVLNWSYGSSDQGAGTGWRSITGRMVIPPGAESIRPRIMGSGKADFWVGSFAARKVGSLEDLRAGPVPQDLSIGNGTIRATFHTADATLSVIDSRSGRTFAQQPPGRDCFVKSASITGGHIAVQLIHLPTGREFSASFEVDATRPEVLARISGSGTLRRSLAYPGPFVTGPGTYLVVPMNEGISYPVDDPSINPMRLVAYGGHGICMAFFGATDGAAGYSAIIETPDDASIHIDRSGPGKPLAITPEWDAQRGAFGYERRLRYCFFDSGGHVAIAKRYRQYVQSTGRFKSFEQKRQENPNIDRLIGAANIWCWDRDRLAIVKELQSAGIQRILWSAGGNPEQLAQMNAMGILTSRYDIYQDVMDPARFPLLRGVSSSWVTAAWPKDLMLDAAGNWVRGWGVRSKTGELIPCGVTCDRQALKYADARIGDELKSHPYLARFIDTTTASPYRECYSPEHPMTRTDSRNYKMQLLGLVSGKYKLVCGSETGHDAAVPVCDFFEGMMSLGPYRVPDAGRDMRRIWTEVPERVAKFQLGHRYRLPLWELVYHECVVAYWYWGDYNNKLPALWDKRDQFNALYATPPMLMFSEPEFRRQQARFVQSYRASAAITRACGYSEMTDHRFLTPDRDVQQTRFSNGMKVTVNFGDRPWRMHDGVAIAAGGIRVEP